MKHAAVHLGPEQTFMRVVEKIRNLLAKVHIHPSKKPGHGAKPKLIFADRDTYQKAPEPTKLRAERRRENPPVAAALPLAALPLVIEPAPKKTPTEIPIISMPNAAELERVYRFDGKTLGTGFCGSVIKATHIASGQPRAIKSIKLEQGSDILFRGEFNGEFLLNLNLTHRDEDKDCAIRAAREVSGLQRINHPAIVKLHEVFLVADAKSDKKKTLVLGMEFIDGKELTDEITQAGYLNEMSVGRYVLSVAEALKYLHDNNLVHRDVKADNIMCQKGTAKLIDLGFTRLVTEDPLSTFCGTELYAAPEVLGGMKYDGKKADVWGLGVVMYTAAVGYLPFGDRREICECKVPFSRSTHLSQSLTDLITRMLDKNPLSRPSIDQVLAHPWMQQAKRLSVATPSLPASASTH